MASKRPKTPRPPKGTPTDLNLYTLHHVFGDKDRVPNAVEATSTAGLRRCLKAGLLRVDGKFLELTPAGLKAIRVERDRADMRKAEKARDSERRGEDPPELRGTSDLLNTERAQYEASGRDRDRAYRHPFDKPMAAPGLVSYRYNGRYGWVMIGAKDDADALREAARSITGPANPALLQRWNGSAYADLPSRPQSAAEIAADYGGSRLQRGLAAEENRASTAIARRLFVRPAHGDPSNVVPVASVEDAQDRWIEFRDRSAEGVSVIGNGVVVVDELGQEVARISYNGRIWPAGEPGPGESAPARPRSEEKLWPDQLRRAVEAMPGNPKQKATLLSLAEKGDRKALLYIEAFLEKHGGLEGAERAAIRRYNAQTPDEVNARDRVTCATCGSDVLASNYNGRYCNRCNGKATPSLKRGP